MLTTSPLLNLPGEIRNSIFELAFSPQPATGPLRVDTSPLALSLTCRQLLHETRRLAFAATTFSVRCQHLNELSAKFKRLPRTLRPLIKRFQVSIDINEFVRQWSSLRGVLFASAGLTGLEELSFQYSGEPDDERSEHLAIATLLGMVWKTVTKCGNDNLRTIRIIHGRSMRFLTYCQFSSGMQQLSRESNSSWTIQTEDVEGRFQLMQRGGDNGRELKIVTVFLGYTVREAELYRKIRERLLKGALLEILQARRSAGIVAPENINKLAFLSEVQQLSRAFRLPYKIDTEALFQAILSSYRP